MIHMAHTMPYWLNGVPNDTHMGAIWNLQTYVNKEHKNQELKWAQSKFAYIDKWTSNDQINPKISNQLWKNPGITDAQITQFLKFTSAQYMGNHRKHIFWPNMYPNPNCTLCPNKALDTWPHILSTCSNQHSKRLRIARHNKAIHQIGRTLQSSRHTRCYTLINAGNQNLIPQDNTIPTWLLQCSCHTTPCTCLARLRPNILCILGTPLPPRKSTSPNANPTLGQTHFRKYIAL